MLAVRLNKLVRAVEDTSVWEVLCSAQTSLQRIKTELRRAQFTLADDQTRLLIIFM